MGKPVIDLSLYLVTSAAVADEAHFLQTIDTALAAGVTLVQLRQKPIDGGAYYRIGQKVKAVTDRYGVPLIIDDRVDVALALDAAGVHVGQSDLPADRVRALVGPEKIIGVSAKSLTQARQAVADSADYLGVGAIFPTKTKEDAERTSIADLRSITAAVPIPVMAIGGIKEANTAQLRGTGIAGISVVSAIMGATDVAEAVTGLRRQVAEIRNWRSAK